MFCVLLGCLFESPRTSCSFPHTSSLLIFHCPSGSLSPVQLPFIRFSFTFPVLFSTPLPFFSPSGVPENIGPESYEWHVRSGISKSFIICSGVVCVCVCMCVCFGYTGWLAQGAQEFPNHSPTRNGRITEAERKRLHSERPAVAQGRF